LRSILAAVRIRAADPKVRTGGPRVMTRFQLWARALVIDHARRYFDIAAIRIEGPPISISGRQILLKATCT